MTSTLSPSAVLDRYFQETRCKIIEIAATLDRLDRAADGASAPSDRRLEQIRRSLGILFEESSDRALKCQMAFSLPYDEGWTPPRDR